MTDLETAKLMGKSDALEVTYKLSRLIATVVDSSSISSIQREILQILTETVTLAAPISSKATQELFSEVENRQAYYQAFEEHMREVGLLKQEQDSSFERLLQATLR